MVHVDFKTFKRTPKPCSQFFKGIIEYHGFTTAMVDKYLPELPKFRLYK